MKRILHIGIPSLLLVIAGAFLLWLADSSTNRGFHHGYWGAYNRIQSALEDL